MDTGSTFAAILCGVTAGQMSQMIAGTHLSRLNTSLDHSYQVHCLLKNLRSLLPFDFNFPPSSIPCDYATATRREWISAWSLSDFRGILT